MPTMYVKTLDSRRRCARASQQAELASVETSRSSVTASAHMTTTFAFLQTAPLRYSWLRGHGFVIHGICRGLQMRGCFIYDNHIKLPDRAHGVDPSGTEVYIEASGTLHRYDHPSLQKQRPIRVLYQVRPTLGKTPCPRP
jgi:hypothetical protein